MSEPVVRAVVIAVAAAVVVLLVWSLGRRRPQQRRITMEGSGLVSTLVLFTSSDCRNCAATRARFEEAGVPFREVTWELEPHVLEGAGVESVPTSVVLGVEGDVVHQVSGIPSSREVKRMKRMLGRDGGRGYRTSP